MGECFRSRCLKQGRQRHSVATRDEWVMATWGVSTGVHSLGVSQRGNSLP